MIKSPHYIHRGFLGGAVVKNPPANAGDARDVGLIPGSGKSSGVGNGNPLQYCCLKNSMDRGAWKITVHGVAESHTTEHALMPRIQTHTQHYTLFKRPLSQLLMI